MTNQIDNPPLSLYQELDHLRSTNAQLEQDRTILEDANDHLRAEKHRLEASVNVLLEVIKRYEALIILMEAQK